MKIQMLLASALMLSVAGVNAQDAAAPAADGAMAGSGQACSELIALDEASASAYLQGYQAGMRDGAGGGSAMNAAPPAGPAPAANPAPAGDAPAPAPDAPMAAPAVDAPPAAGSPETPAPAPEEAPAADGAMPTEPTAEAPMAGDAAGAAAGMAANAEAGAFNVQSIIETCRQYPDNLLSDAIMQSQSATTTATP